MQSIPGAAKLWLSLTETRLREKGDVPNGTNMRVLMLAPSNQIATLVSTAMLSNLEFNGKAPSAQPNDFKQIQPSATDVDFAAVAAQIVAFKPHVIFFINGETTFTEYIPRVEAAWPANTPRPHYIMSPNEADEKMFGNAVIGNDALRKRITGLTDWQSEATFGNYDAFVGRYKAVYKDEFPEAAAGYEGFYLVANATLAAVNDTATVFGKLSGVDIARNFPLVVDQKSTKIVDTTPLQIPIGIDSLRVRESIRQRGVYSEFDYDPVSGAQKTDIAVYCGAFDAKNRFSMRGGLIFRHATQKADGPFDATLCDF